MVIKNLALTNYRRFRKVELKLPESIIGIIGNNGTGKTTLVEAIGWCLYGKRFLGEDIRSQFCEPAADCAVEMTFFCDANEYRLVRKLKGKTAAVEAAIYKNAQSEPVAAQECEVNEYIENLLNLDFRSFFISVFAGQQDFVAMQAEKKRKSIAHPIHIGTINQVRQPIRNDKKSKQEVSSGFEASLKDDQESKLLNKNLKLEWEKTNQQKSVLAEQFEALQDQQKIVKSEFERIVGLREKHFQLQTRIDKWLRLIESAEDRKKKHLAQMAIIHQTQKEVELLKPQLKKYKKVQAEKEKLDKASSFFYQLQAMIEEKQRLTQRLTREQYNLTKLKEELKGFEGIDERIKQQNQEIDQLTILLKQARQEQLKIEGQLTSILTRGQELKQKKENIEKLGLESPCPVCTSLLKDQYYSVVAHFDEELMDLRKQFTELDKMKKEIQAQLQQIENQMKKAAANRDGFLQAQEQFKEREKRRKQAQEMHNELEDYLNDLQKKISALGKIEYDEKEHRNCSKKFKELAEIRDQVLRYDEQIKRLSEEQKELELVDNDLAEFLAEKSEDEQLVTELKYDDLQYLQVKKEVEDLQKAAEAKKDELHSTEQKLITLEKDIERVTQELEIVDKVRQQIAEIKEEISSLEMPDLLFEIFSQELPDKMRPLIASRASELLSSTTQGRYSIMELDEDYNIFLYDQSMKFPLARFSGGEQDLMNVCLRIAISQVVAERAGRSRINFIVLDEIFGSQDERRKKLILSALQRLSPSFRQIFIITHVAGVKDSLPVIISVTEKSAMESLAILR